MYMYSFAEFTMENKEKLEKELREKWDKEIKEKQMDLKFRDIQILNKNGETIYVDRQIVGDIIVREHRIDVVNKGAITKTIVLPEYLEGIKVLID